MKSQDRKSRKKTERESDSANRWNERKSAFMVKRLGPEHDMVMHAVIPFSLGGALDLYYFPRGTEGTAIATKELCEWPREGPRNRSCDCYELVMFTRAPLNLEHAKKKSTAFGKAHSRINQILNGIARYAFEATLNPNETCGDPPGPCLIFCDYGNFKDKEAGTFGLLLLLEIQGSEMAYAREHGSAKLISRLKARGFFPYSDLDRPSVV